MDWSIESHTFRGAARSSVVAAGLASLFLLATCTASADVATWWNETTPESTPGLQLGLSGGIPIAIGVDEYLKDTRFRAQGSRNRNTKTEIEPGLALHVRAGYRIHPRIVVEGQFEWNSESSVDAKDTLRTNPTSQSDVARIETWVATANFKFYPLSLGRVQPWLVYGVGAMRFQGDNRSPRIPANERQIFEFNTDGERQTDFAMRAGMGLDIHFTDHLSFVLGASYVIPAGKLDRFDYVSTEWGLQYRF
jgi:opacity protein-like surface antigen